MAIIERYKAAEHAPAIPIHDVYTEEQRNVLKCAASLYFNKRPMLNTAKSVIGDMTGKSAQGVILTHNQFAYLSLLIGSDKMLSANAEFLESQGLTFNVVEKIYNTISYDAVNESFVLRTTGSRSANLIAIDCPMGSWRDSSKPNQYRIPIKVVREINEFVEYFIQRKDNPFKPDAKASAMIEILGGKNVVIDDENEEVKISIYIPDDVKAKISQLENVEMDEDGYTLPMTPDVLALLKSLEGKLNLSSSVLERMSRWDAENEELEREDQLRWLRAVNYLDESGDWQNPILLNNKGIYAKTALREYQKRAIERIATKEFFLFSAKAGAGKTIVAYIAANAVRQGRPMPIVVVCPKSVVGEWESTVSELRKQFRAWPAPIKIYKWDSLPTPDGKGWIFEDYPDGFILITDEAHYAKNTTSSRYKKVIAITSHPNCKAAILLTGTPVLNGRPAELFPLLCMVGHPLAKLGRKKYLAKFTKKKELAKLRVAIADCSMTVPESELGLPPIVNNYHRVPMTKENSARYDDYLNPQIERYEDLIKEGERKKESATLFMIGKARQASSWAKAEFAVSLALDLLEQEQKSLIFTEFQDSTDHIFKLLEKALPGRVRKIDGKVTNNTVRRQYVTDMVEGNADILVATAATMGTGVNRLQFAAYNLIFVDMQWNPGRLEQSIGRLRRSGQKSEHVMVHHLKFAPIDEAIIELVLEKQDRIMALGFLETKTLTQEEQAQVDEIADKTGAEELQGLVKAALTRIK